MKIVCIIPSLYSVDKDYLKLTVESLRATVDWDIVVVTNGSPASEPLQFGGVTRRLHTKDQGQCNAVNIGASTVDVDYLFIVNSDMYFAPGWNKNLRFDHLVFSPNLVEPTNNAGSAIPFKKCDGGFTLEEFRKEKVDKYITDLIKGYSKKPHKKESGFNLPFLIRKDVWDTIGGYDIAYDPWGSNGDTDLQTKINLAGITPIRLRDVLVYHFSNKSGTFDGTHQDAWQFNWDYFNSKWGFDRDQLGSDVWYNKNMLPKDLEQIKYQPDWINKYKEKK